VSIFNGHLPQALLYVQQLPSNQPQTQPEEIRIGPKAYHSSFDDD